MRPLSHPAAEPRDAYHAESRAKPTEHRHLPERRDCSLGDLVRLALWWTPVAFYRSAATQTEC